MNISEFCIKRPVFATVLSLILIIIGVVGYNNLNTRFFPKFTKSSIIITTTYPGASAALVETSVTTPLEKNISIVDGIKNLQSSSTQGSSNITIELKPDSDAFQVADLVRNRVAFAMNLLPANIKAPIVTAGHGTDELIDFGFISNSMSLNELRDYLDRFVTNAITEVPGVAAVNIFGANPYAMRIWLDPKAMNARHVTLTDIQTAITNANVELPAGSIKTKTIELPITAKTKLVNPDDFANIVIKDDNGTPIRIKDVAHVKLGTDTNQKVIVRVNGQQGLLLEIFNNEDANPIDTADRVKIVMKNIQSQLPPGISVAPSWDQSTYMKASVHEVYVSIAIAVLCVILVIMAFLGKIRDALVPIVTIPICLISAFGVMYLLGFTIDVITLLALVLCIGLIVDDAIVVLENIHRHIERGMSSMQAAIQGSREITFPIIAMTITLAAVYAPIGLVHGQGANMFKSFAFTLAGTVIISGFIALTLSPMMCSRLLKPVQNLKPNSYGQHLEHIFQWLQSHYQAGLKHILRFRLAVVLSTIAIAVGGYFLFSALPKAFIPTEDMGFMISLITIPNGTKPEVIDQQFSRISNIVNNLPETLSTMSFTNTGAGENNNIMFSMLKPYDQRQRNSDTLAKIVNDATDKIPAINSTTLSPRFGGNMQGELQFFIVGGNTYQDLSDASQKIMTALKKNPNFKNVTSNMNFDNQGYDLTVHREIANQLHVSVQDIDSTLQSLLGGESVSTFDMNGQNYYVYLQAQKRYRQSIEAVDDFFVQNASGEQIPLSTLVSITPTLTQSALQHYNQLHAAEISISLNPGYKLGQAIQTLQKTLPDLLPSNIKYSFTGEAEQALESNDSMGMIFLLAIAFIYLVLSAQFESFLDPFVILLAVPLSIVGALLSLKVFGGSINIYTSIGLVTLIGLISKHGILITQFANQLHRNGTDAAEALIQAAGIRLRPILMTTAAMIFGALPLLLSSGAGANSRHEIAVVIIGGLLFGTFFSLILVPVAYSYAQKLKTTVSRYR